MWYWYIKLGMQKLLNISKTKCQYRHNWSTWNVALVSVRPCPIELMLILQITPTIFIATKTKGL